jgi:23S rRNA (cytosine1962-C5)-methyltransferase
MGNLTSVILKPGEADRVIAGHPWIYKGSILRLSQPAGDGDVVQVKDHRQRLLGTAFYTSRSKIALRMLDPDRVAVDEGFFETRIRAALAFRQRHLPGATSFRLVNAEGDFLSGLIVDQYEDVLSLQISSLGMDRHKAELVGALEKVCHPRAIVERSDVSSRKFEGLAETRGLITGELSGPLTIQMSGIRLEADVLGGHKTGLYLDQQLNYAAVARFAPGAQVLDCFSFLGGFGLHAARAGAAHVHMLDQSEDAVAASLRNAAVNGLSDVCSAQAVNVFDWLKAQTQAGTHEKVVPKFDLIVLDPPSFTRNRASVPDALRGYKEIHLRALRLLKPGGVLATFCCSHHVNTALFQDVILSAAFDARKILRRVATYAQSPDHPIIPSIPETEYLKGFALELVR